MFMSKWKNKAIACMLAVSSIAASVGSLEVDAVGLSAAPNSEFQYELTAEVVSDSRVKVTFTVTNNPGAAQVGVVFKYDDYCNFCSCLPSDVLLSTKYKLIQNPMPNKNVHMVDFCTNYLQENQKWPWDGNDCYSYSIYFDVDEERPAGTKYEFSATVYNYTSVTENIKFNNINNECEYDPECSVATMIQGGKEYKLGDVDGNGLIEISDASEIYSIASHMGGSVSVADFNAGLNDHSSSWHEMFSHVPCGELANVCDVDAGYINLADYNEVLNYYSQYGASLPVEHFQVGKTYTKNAIVVV